MDLMGKVKTLGTMGALLKDMERDDLSPKTVETMRRQTMELLKDVIHDEAFTTTGARDAVGKRDWTEYGSYVGLQADIFFRSLRTVVDALYALRDLELEALWKKEKESEEG